MTQSVGAASQPRTQLLSLGLAPVSYTHLDVYKRQLHAGAGVRRAADDLHGLARAGIDHADAQAVGVGTVSYTHLDVYKRQQQE